jgi:hypothetical protein
VPFKSFVAKMCLAAALFAISQAQAQYILGPRGGCYTVTESGKKRYVDRSLCDPKPGDKPSARPSASTPSSSKYIRGPKGGCYYVTPSGRKQYVDRSLCG